MKRYTHMGNANNRGKLENWYLADHAKAERLAKVQAGKVRRRTRPLSKRHCLIVAGFCLILAISLILINWGR